MQRDLHKVREVFPTMARMEEELRSELLTLCLRYAESIKWREATYRRRRPEDPNAPMKRTTAGVRANIFEDSDSEDEAGPSGALAGLRDEDYTLLPASSTYKRIEEDVHDFVVERMNLGREKDALGWWSRHMSRWPMVAAVARHSLCIPASSATSDRAFSKTGHIMRARRASLSDTNIERLTFLSWNVDMM